MTRAEPPDPLVAPSVDLKDFPYTPIYRARLFGSAFHARATDSEWRAGVTLWLRSQDQVPAGSLPDDDLELCRLAELGRDIKAWRKLKAGALHGWVKCSDGRLYNSVVASVVYEQWDRKTSQRNRTLKARVAALEKRLSQTSDVSVADDIKDQLQSLRQALLQSQPHSLQQCGEISATEDVTMPVTETKRREEKRSKIDNSRRHSTTPPAGGDPIDDDDLIKKLRSAGGGDIDEVILSPAGVVPIKALIDLHGFDLEKHILPAISDVCRHLTKPPLHSFSASFLRPKFEAQKAEAEAERAAKARTDMAAKVFVEHGTPAWGLAAERYKAAGKAVPSPIKSETNQGRMGWYFDAAEAVHDRHEPT